MYHLSMALPTGTRTEAYEGLPNLIKLKCSVFLNGCCRVMQYGCPHTFSISPSLPALVLFCGSSMHMFELRSH